MAINLGDKFESFHSFEETLERFKAETNTDFYIGDSRTLDTARKLYPQRIGNAQKILKYYNVKYKCIHGGKYSKNKQSKGLRNTSTIRIGCKAFIYLTLSEDGTALVVTGLHLEHNHDTNEEIYIEVPTHRRRNLSKLRVKVTESNVKKKKNFAQKNIAEDLQNAALLQDVTNLNALNLGAEMLVETNYESNDGAEINQNPAENASNSLPVGEEVHSSEHKLCRCGIGTFDLTKQDLMKMEVEEHYHRLEVLQLQKAYEAERIEKMRYLYDLKIRLAEQELQNSNF